MKKLSKLNEHLWSGIISRSESGEVRTEQGYAVGKTKDGITLNLSTESRSRGELYEVDGTQVFYLDELDVYFCVVDEGDCDSYYRYEPDEEEREERGINLVSWFGGVCPELKTQNFSWLRGIVDAAEVGIKDLESLDTKEYNYKYDEIDFEVAGYGFKSFDNYDNAEQRAIDDLEEMFEQDGISDDDIKRCIRILGCTFFNIDSINDDLVQSYEIQWDDYDEDDRVKWLIDKKIIDETDEYFETDEDGEINTDRPLFDTGDYKDNFVEHNTNNRSDEELVKEWLGIFGTDIDTIKEYIDYYELAKQSIEHDGVENQLAIYDGNEISVTENGHTYYFYRTE